MVPLERLPGFAAWGPRLGALVEFPGPLYIWGEPGSGVSTFLNWICERRGQPGLDDLGADAAGQAAAFFAANPSAAAGGHLDPDSPAIAAALAGCLHFRLPSVEEDPHCLPELTEALAAEEGLDGPLPSSLWILPCPGNLAGLRNRIHRWRLLGQVPGLQDSDALQPLEAEDLATNLHALERVLLFRALRRSYGNRVEAAVRLGVSRRQLYLLIARHGDPVRGEQAGTDRPKRLIRQEKRQNSSRGEGSR
jgi:hypothetical protein